MDISNGRLGFTQDLDNQKFLNALRQSNRGVTDFNAHLQQNFNQSLISVNDLAKGVTAFLTIDYATQFASQIVKVRGEFEQLEIAFTTMLGSKEKADQLMQEIVTFAATTPFGLQSTSEATKMLLAYGESADTALDTMRKLGDIASGVGIPLKDIAYLYGTTMTQGRLYTQDLNQFLGRGIPMMDELAKVLGVAKNEVKGLVEDGKVGFPEVQKAIDNLTASGSMFGGLMEAQSKSVSGQIEQLKDAIDVMFNEIGKSSQGTISTIIGGTAEVIENYETIGKAIAILITAYGTYKAALIAFSVAQKIVASSTTATMYLEMSRSIGTLTTAHKARAVAIGLEASAQKALNAVMAVNPYVMIAVAIGTVVSAYFLLRDSTDSATKAQEAYNKTQEEVKSKLDETKQKAEEYISVLKDETATVFQQIQAYKALQALKLKGLENLTQEQIATMDLTELRKLLNVAYDDNSLQAQEQELKRIETEIKGKKNEILQLNETSFYSKNKLEKQVEALNLQYDLQKEKIAQINQEQMLANLPLKDRAKYWEDEVSRIQGVINEIENTNSKHVDTKNILGTNVELSTVFKSTLNAVNINPLLSQLDVAKQQFSILNSQINGSGIAEIKDKAYYDNIKKQAQSTLDGLDLTDSKNTEKIKGLTIIINGATKALEKYNVAVKAPKAESKKSTSTKKSEDLFEVYKKQIQSVKEDYERFVDYMNSDDLVLKNSGKIQYETLSKNGATYEEFLRRLQKQLVGTSNKSALQVKQLRFINDELLKTIDYNAFDKFKEGIENSISESENLLEVLGKIQEEKSKLQGNTDQISVDKLKFLDEKEIENIKKTDDAAKDLIRTLTEDSKPLDVINKKFDAQLFLLKKKINDANEEISKLTISAKSSPEGSNERIKIEEQILKLKKEILDTQNLIDFNESKRTVETKNVTNNTDYNKLISEYQSYEDKIKAIDDKMKADLLTNQTYYEAQKKALIEQGKLDEIKALDDIKKAKDAQIEKQATDDTSSILKDKLMGSEEWENLFSNMDEMTFQQIDNLIKQIEGKFNLLKGKFNPIDLKVILKQLNQAKNLVIEKNPFGSLAVGLADLFKGAEEETNSSTEGITTKWNRVAKSLTGTFDFINDAIDSAGVLKEFLGETASSAMETTQTVLSIGSSVLAVSQMTTEGIKGVERASVILAIISAVIQIATKIANLLSNLFSKDKKKQKEINKHKEAVDNLTNSYKDLEDAAKRALGSDVYSGQKQMIENLKQQQIEYQKMIELEKGKKKKDAGKIKEWEDALRDSKNTIQDLLEEIAEDVVQTNAKDLATELGDALVEAFGKGEDAAKAFAEVANNVLKNTVLNQLKKQFLEKQLQAALDKLYKDMGGDDEGNFNFNGLTPEEQEEFRNKIKEISQNFTGMLDQYSDLFGDLIDPNETAMAGAIKGMSEETGSALLGQFNAIRILQKELVTINVDSNKILLNSLDRLANIDYNTRSVLPLLEKLISKVEGLGNNRSYGF